VNSSLRAAAAVALLFVTACVETFKVAPSQLQYLNGYTLRGEKPPGGQPRTELPYRLTSTQGKPVEYDSTKKLLLLSSTEQPLAPTGPFESISLTENSFDAVPVAGPPVQVPLKSIKAVEVSQPSPERTSQLIIAVSFVSVLLLVGVTLAIAH
jgi:hypothetical protein